MGRKVDFHVVNILKIVLEIVTKTIVKMNIEASDAVMYVTYIIKNASFLEEASVN